MASPFVDDKTPICIPFILDRLKVAQTESPNVPFLIGLNGIQGVGKTTLVRNLADELEGRGIHTIACSIDDFYSTHEEQQRLASENPDNLLVQHRGEPGTHDIKLLTSVVNDLVQGKPTSIPEYDKAAFSGQGDRFPESQWKAVNQPGQPSVQVVIFEGWLVGFRALSPHAVEAKWKAPSRTLQKHKLEHLALVNNKLESYGDITSMLSAFVHIDSEDTEYVYAWRLEQEEHLRAERGDTNAGMTPEQVTTFVDGYYPGYELYTDGVRSGVFSGRPGCQLRMVVGRDRKVKQVIQI